MSPLYKQKSLPFILLLAAILLVSFVSVGAALDGSVPTITSNTPGSGVTLYSANVNISFVVTDLNDNIQNSNYFIKVNGNMIPSTLKYKGHASGSQWIVDSYLQATITANATNLGDGLQTVEVQAMDQAGNIVTKSWTFKVLSRPTFSSPNPAHGSLTVNNTNFSVRVSDNGEIDPTSIKVALNTATNYVTHSFDPATGVIAYTAPTPLVDGKYTVFATVKDKAGNAASYTWSYTVLATGPALSYADAGKTFTVPNPLVTVGVKAPSALDSGSIQIDGQPVSTTFTYKGHWYYPTDSDTPTWVVDNYNEATLTAQLTNLSDGIHVVSATAKDQAGNTKTAEWNITVKIIPTFAEPSPANGTSTTDNRGFSLKVADNQPLNPTDIAVKLDGVSVPTSYDPATGLITYQPASTITDGTHKVDVSVKDSNGNLANYTWSFTIQTVGPDLLFSYADKAIDTFKPTLSVALKSNAKIQDSGYEMLIDNQPVQAIFNYQGSWVSSPYQDSTWVASDKEASLSFTPAGLKDGPHTLSVTAKDVLNNVSTMSWNFTIAQKPLFTELEPSDGMTITNLTPTIKATISDPNNADLELAKIKLVINNQAVTPVLSKANGTVLLSYTPTGLTNDSFNNISLTAADASGNTNTTTWKFNINTKGDMPVSNKDCGLCHTLNQYTKYEHTTKGPYGFDKATFFHGQGNNCQHCHVSYTAKFCGYCHNGDAADIALGNATPDPTLEAGKSCLECHSPNPNVIGTSTSSIDGVTHQVNTGINPLTLNASNIVTHDILPLHNAVNPSCAKCHSTYLTREHNRVSKAGVQLDCATCHGSTRAEVKQAIATNNTDCSACHTQAGHQAQHVSPLDVKCQSCHAATLIDDHLNNEKTTAGKNYSCDTCHASTSTNVQRSIAANDKGCAGCHTQAHNIGLVASVPSDIPLYDSFQWSSVLEASIFASDPATPNGYDTGQLLISNRSTAVTAAQVWNYYNQELTAQGWVVSNSPAPGAINFASEFQKDGRFLMVRCFNTAQGDGKGPEVGTGYRVELWFR